MPATAYGVSRTALRALAKARVMSAIVSESTEPMAEAR